MWKCAVFLFVCLHFCGAAAAVAAGPEVTVVLGEKAPPLEKAAAAQLVTDLEVLFDAKAVIGTTGAPQSGGGAVILLGSPETNPAIAREGWPRLSPNGHVVKSTPAGLILGGDTPRAVVWAVSEFSHHFGMRHMLYGDVPPVVKPAFTLAGLDIVLDAPSKSRWWQPSSGQASGMESWSFEDLEKLLQQLVKLKFTHLRLPAKATVFPAISVTGDTAGRKAFGGAKTFANPEAEQVFARIQERAVELGLGVMTSDGPATHVLNLSGSTQSVLPQFSLAGLGGQFRALPDAGREGIAAAAGMPGDLNACAYFISRAAFDERMTAERALTDLVTPICGEGVAERLWKGFDFVTQAAKVIQANDAAAGVPDANVLLRHLESKEPPAAWITEVKTLYGSAMSEMYRANTRARDGARPFILYHAKRMEFAVHYFTALEALHKWGAAKAKGDADAVAEASEQALEGIYNALNAYADVARDASDRGAIALLNEHGYRALQKAME